MKPINKYKMMILAAALSFAGTQGATAQQTRNISLNEAIELGLKNSHQLKINQAKVMEASAALKEAKEHRLPDLSIQGAYMYLPVQPTIDMKTGGQGQEGSGMPNMEIKQLGYGMANASVPVFTGFKIQYGIEAANYLQKATQLDAENNRNDVIQNIINSYSNLYKASAAVDIVKDQLKQSQQRVADFSSMEKNGLIARNDLLRAQLQESNVELALVDAENNWKITYITMNLLLGLDQDLLLVPDSNDLQTTANAGNFNEWESTALQNRKDLLALDYRKKAADAGIKVAKGDYYPSLAATGGYVGANIPNFLTITNAINVGVGINYSPSSLWKTGAKVSQAKAQLQQVQASEAQLSDVIRLQTAQAYQAYVSAQKKIEMYNKAYEQSSENYRIVNNKYMNSLATTTELLDAVVLNLQAKLNVATAKADAMVAYNKLLQTTGTLNY